MKALSKWSSPPPGRQWSMPEVDPNSSPPEKGSAQAFNHLDKGDVFPVDRTVGDADPSDYDALVLPGGPNVLVTSRKPDDLPAFCTELVYAFSHAGQPA
jgi:protease I